MIEEDAGPTDAAPQENQRSSDNVSEHPPPFKHWDVSALLAGGLEIKSFF